MATQSPAPSIAEQAAQRASYSPDINRRIIALATALLPTLARAAPRDELLRLVPDDVAFCLVVQDLRGHAEALSASPFADEIMPAYVAHQTFEPQACRRCPKAPGSPASPQIPDERPRA